MKGLAETTEERKERLRARARDLIGRREKEKRQFAEEMDRAQFRKTSDLFRHADSIRLLEHCKDVNTESLKIRQAAIEQEREEDKVWHKKYLDLGEALEEHERRDKRAANVRRDEMN